MERESFENAAVAAVLNETCVSIKVDREERPDVDRVYMAFVQATTGQGGWPMSVWLTPDLKPFHGGTYFPPSGRWGRPGFVDLLREIARVWREERPKVLAASSVVVDRLAAFQSTDADDAGGAGAIPGLDALADAADQFARTFDRRFGGFGGAPKFPRPSELLLLLRAWTRRTGGRRDDLRDMVVATLGAMAKGGMRDHIGGGFHRYSVDERWRVPHFEKMLYDQAQLVLALIEASQAAADPLLAAVADDTLVYVDRDLSDAGGGFYSAEDADSIPPESAGQPGAHASEGAFYIWPQREVETLLGEADARVVALRFGLEPGGNAPFDPQQEFTGKNLLYTAATFEDIAARVGRPVDDVVDVVARARPVLLEARNRRPRPSLDDKVLTSWNGLMIAAMARAGRDPRRRRSGARRAVDRPRRARGALRPLGALAAGDADAASPLARRRRRHRRLLRGLRRHRLGLPRAAAGDRRSGVAGLGPRGAGGAGSAVLGRGRRRLVQHHRARPVRAAPSQGGVRRRRAGGRLRRGPQPDRAGAPRTGRGRVAADRPHARPARAAPRRRRARRAVHGHEPGRLASRPDPDRGRRPARSRRHARAPARRRRTRICPRSLVLPVDPAGRSGPGSLAAACRGSLRSPCATAPPPPMSVAPSPASSRSRRPPRLPPFSGSSRRCA